MADLSFALFTGGTTITGNLRAHGRALPSAIPGDQRRTLEHRGRHYELRRTVAAGLKNSPLVSPSGNAAKLQGEKQ